MLFIQKEEETIFFFLPNKKNIIIKTNMDATNHKIKLTE